MEDLSQQYRHRLGVIGFMLTTRWHKARVQFQQQDLVPLPLTASKMILSLLQHLDFRNRFKRRDLVSLIHRFHAKRSRIAPQVTEYRLREANPLRTILLDKQAPTFMQWSSVRCSAPGPFVDFQSNGISSLQEMLQQKRGVLVLS